MYRQAGLCIFLVGVLSGCSTLTTARTPSTVSQMRIQMAKLERKLSDSESEMQALKGQIQTLEARVQKWDSYDIAAATTGYDAPLSYDTLETNSADDIFIKSEGAFTRDEDNVRVNTSVESVQTALKNAGYYTGTIDGKYGARSKSAVFAFQKDHDLSSDGIVGKQTWSELSHYLK